MSRIKDVTFRHVWFLFVIIFVQMLTFASARKTRDMIYTDVTGFSPCVRRFNATHQIGCASDFYGNRGVIHYMTKTSDVQWLIDNGPYQPYIGLMEPQVFNYPTVNKLMKSGKISGIMVINVNLSQVYQEDFYFSPDLKCPNDNYGFYTDVNGSEYAHCKDVEWNPSGNGMNFMNFDIPMISLSNESEVERLIQCYETHNEPVDGQARPYPLCAVELHSFMFGAKDTPTCMRRTQQTTNLELSFFCDPLGDYNVWGTLKPTNKSQPHKPKSLIVAAAQLDSFSLFYKVQPSCGAEHAATSYITLLAVAQALGQLNSTIKQDMADIMFIFFEGESYDYIGSSRMVYDMLNGSFPFLLEDGKMQPALVDIDNIAYFVELKQLGMVENGNLYAHSDPITQANEETQNQTNKILDSLQTSSAGTGINVLPSQPLPPASFQQFLRSGVKVPGLVLTDHQREYHNKYYNSRFDTAEQINFDEEGNSELASSLSDIATTVARALYKLARPNATDKESQAITANATTIDDMLVCFMVRANCSLFNSLASKKEADSLINVNYDGFVGIAETNQHSLGQFIYRLLGFFTGNSTEVEHSDDDSDDSPNPCEDQDDNQISHSFFMQGENPRDGYGYCVEGNMNLAKALSPAFIDGQEDWTSTKYSTWTESRWKDGGAISARMYLKPSPAQESVIFCLGAAIFLLSMLISYFLNARASILFSPM